jgi:hypothetical protein
MNPTPLAVTVVHPKSRPTVAERRSARLPAAAKPGPDLQPTHRSAPAHHRPTDEIARNHP